MGDDEDVRNRKRSNSKALKLDKDVMNTIVDIYLINEFNSYCVLFEKYREDLHLKRILK